MRIPITPLGRREIAVCTVVLFAAASVALHLFSPAAVVPLVLWVWVLSFFRDPDRTVPDEAKVLLSPADGTVRDITHMDEDPHIGGPATRIGIFMSVFNVHVNRFPVAGRVVSVTAKPGRFHDARDPRAITDNVSNTIVLDPDDSSWIGPLAVRQITGFVARRIVCHAGPGDHLDAGERFGMIKFGSRLEVIVPAANQLDVAVNVGQKTKAGLTILAKLNPGKSKTDAPTGPERGRPTAGESNIK